MGRRSEHTQEQQRDMSIVAAEGILVREGPAALSMRKVADVIGYTVGNLYLLFENQDDLLATLNERTADAIYAHLRAASARKREPLSAMRQMAAAYIEFAHLHPHRFRLLFEHQMPQPKVPRVSADLRIERLFGMVESTIAPLLPGLRAQQLRIASATLWSGIHGIGMLAVSGKLAWSGVADFRPFSDTLVTAFLKGHRGAVRDVIKLPSNRHSTTSGRGQTIAHEQKNNG